MRVLSIAGIATLLLLLLVTAPAGACEDEGYAMEAPTVVASATVTPAAPPVESVTVQSATPQAASTDASAAKTK
jgi:hypothetical protein